MKKFLLVLLLVLCMALPAAAKTWTVSDDSPTEHGIRYAVANADNGDTIVISAGIDLSATEHVDYNCGLCIPSSKTLTLQISEDCTLAVNASSGKVVGIYNEGGNLTIEGKGTLTLTVQSGGNDAYGVLVDAGTVNIDGGVHITSTLDSLSGPAFGVYVNGGTANILSADISVSGGSDVRSVARYNGTLNVYAGTFSCGGSPDENVPYYYWGPDSDGESKGDKFVVTNNAAIKFTPESLDVTQGETGSVDVSLLDKDENGCTIDSIEVTPASVDGITVTPSSSDGKITFTVTNTCALDTYPFSVFCESKNEKGTHLQTGTFTVTVSKPKESTLTVTPTSATVAKGSSAVFTADMKTDDKSVNITKIEAKGLPEGMTCTLNGKTVTIATTDKCAVGEYQLTLTATGGGKNTAEAKITVTVSEPKAESTLTVTPKSAAVIKGSSATFTADMKTDGKSVEIAKIEIEELPEGMTCTLNGKTVTIATTDKCAVGSYPLTLTAIGKDDNTAEANIIVEVVTQGQPVLPEIKEELPKDVENVVAEPEENIEAAAGKTQIAAENLEQPDKETGYVYPTEDYTKAAVKAADIFADKTNVQVNDVCRMPVSEASTTESGKTLLISFSVKGEELVKYATNPADLMVFEVGSDSTSEQYKAAKSIGDLTDGHFAVLKTNGEILSAEIDSKETYTLCVAIKDGGDFDLDGQENKKVVDPTVIANVSYDGKPSSASNGGCNAGFAGLALAAFALLAAKRKK